MGDPSTFVDGWNLHQRCSASRNEISEWPAGWRVPSVCRSDWAVYSHRDPLYRRYHAYLKFDASPKPDELMAVYRQRYIVYVEELKYPQRYANHQRKWLSNRLTVMDIFLGLSKTEYSLVRYGSTTAVRSLSVDYIDLYDMRRFASYFPERVSICTNSSLPGRVAQA